MTRTVDGAAVRRMLEPSLSDWTRVVPSCGDDSSFESKHGKNGSIAIHIASPRLSQMSMHAARTFAQETFHHYLAMSAGALAAADHERAHGDGIVLERFPVGAALFHA
jgi:hypothetical protein